MDADIPVLDGYKAFKQIKEIDNNANVIIVTGFSDMEPRSNEIRTSQNNFKAIRSR